MQDGTIEAATEAIIETIETAIELRKREEHRAHPMDPGTGRVAADDAAKEAEEAAAVILKMTGRARDQIGGTERTPPIRIKKDEPIEVDVRRKMRRKASYLNS